MSKEKVLLRKGASEFTLIGKIKLNKFTFTIDQESKNENSDWIYNRLNLAVDCGNGNTVYCESMGGYGSERDNVVYAHGKKLVEGTTDKYIDDFKNQLKIAWEDRFNEDILSEVGNRKFFRIGIEKDDKNKTFTKRFITEYDMIEYLEKNKELLENLIVRIDGKISYSSYNDNIQTRKEIKSIYISNAEPEDFKAVFKQSILLDKYSIGKKDKETGLVPINASVIDYVKDFNGKEVRTNIPFARNFYVENEKLLKLLKVRKDITELIVIGKIIEGEEKVAIEYDDLDQDIKDLIDIGAYTLEEVAKTMAVTNTRVNQWIIEKPEIRMIGEDENKIPQIQIEEKKYTEDDLILDFMIENDEDNYELESDDNEDEDEDDDEDLSFLDELEGE